MHEKQKDIKKEKRAYVFYVDLNKVNQNKAGKGFS